MAVRVFVDADFSPDEMRSERCFWDLQAQTLVADRIIGPHGALLLDAQNVDIPLVTVSDEGRTGLFRQDGEALVVGWNIGLADEAIGGFNILDFGQTEFIDQAVL